VKIFCGHDGGSGCAWYRMQMPMDQLAAHGHDVTVASASKDNGAPGIRASEMAGHDVIVGQRLNSPEGAQVWRSAWSPQSRLVYELDDDIFSITAENFGAYVLFGRPEVREAVIHAIEVSDLVTASTEQLAAVLRKYNPNVTVLPNHIPAWVCDLDRPRRARPSVGWMGGASHGVDVGLIVSPVRRFLKRFPGWDLRLGGTDYRPTFKAGDRGVFSQWVQVNKDPEGFYGSMDFDIGLAPVAPSVFTASKSHVKALEYAALGIPVIASDWYPYRDFVRHGETGFLVRHDHEWLKYMSELAADDGLREQMGAKARELARQWTIEEGWRMWADAYEGLFR
jgi:glycosyltransferase involved in cell wall biosynthesis